MPVQRVPTEHVSMEVTSLRIAFELNCSQMDALSREVSVGKQGNAG